MTSTSGILATLPCVSMVVSSVLLWIAGRRCADVLFLCICSLLPTLYVPLRCVLLARPSRSACVLFLLACSLVYVVSLALVYLGDFFSISGHVCFKISINGKLYVFRPRRRLHLRRTTLQEMGSSMRKCESSVSFMIRIPFPQMLIE